MKIYSLLVLIISFVLFSSPAYSDPDCSTMPTCIAEDAQNTSVGPHTHVQDAVDLCISTEGCTTVTIPTGTVTWDTPVTLDTKGITVQGQGPSNTIITTTSTAMNQDQAFLVTTNSVASFRITGMKLKSNVSGGHLIKIKKNDIPSSYGWRIDNIVFEQTNGGNDVYINGITYGVIDNCTFSAHEGTGIQIYANTEDDGTFSGQKSWNLPLTLGTNNAVYVENCTFNVDDQKQLTDLYYGGRLVFRHNTVIKGFHTVHPAQSTFRAGHSMEVYNNTYAGGGIYRPSDIRGGTGVIYNNLVTGYESAYFHIRCDRLNGDPGSYGYCDGDAVVDGNVSANGWPCEDQIGWTGGTLGSQTSAPYYSWSNGATSFDGSITLILTTPTESSHIKTTGDSDPHPDGVVDYVNNGVTPKPGYNALQCPHPLVTEYAGYTCDSTKAGAGTDGGYPGNGSAVMSIGSGGSITLGSGATMTLQ